MFTSLQTIGETHDLQRCQISMFQLMKQCPYIQRRNRQVSREFYQVFFIHEYHAKSVSHENHISCEIHRMFT